MSRENDLSDEAFQKYKIALTTPWEGWREAVRRAKANPWQLFPIPQLRLLIFDMEQEGHGEHPMCEDARAALAELERRKA